MNRPAHRILLVDDEPLATKAIKLQLERKGRFVVRDENDSSLALKAALEFKPELILLDVDMPGMDGADVARQIKKSKALEGVQVVFLTSLITRNEALLENCTDHFHVIAKPVPMAILLSILDWLLRSGAGAADTLPPSLVAFLRARTTATHS